MENKMGKGKIYGLYTGLFVCFSFLVFFPFILNGKSFVFYDVTGGGDGLVQHYAAFVYYGEYLRDIVRSLIIDHSLTIPMFDINMGYGQDIIQTLSYYVMGDPFSFLSVFFNTGLSEMGYCLAILLRLYFAGFTFVYFSRYMGKDSGYTLVGAFIYVFSTYGIVVSVLHPYFINPLIYLPIILVGAEKLLRNESPIIFTLAIAISGLSNFYFFYMLCIVTVIYVIMRYVQEKKGIGNLPKCVGRFLLYGIIGSFIAAPLLVPSITNIISSARVNAGAFVPLFYPTQYYKSFIPRFFIGGGTFYTHMGFSLLAVISIVILILRRKDKPENRFTLTAIGISIVFLMFPFFGHLFNGMSYVVNRWIWAMGLAVSYGVTIALPYLKSLSKKEWGIVIGVSAIIGVLNLFLEDEFISEKYLLSLLIPLMALTLFFVALRRENQLYVASIFIVAIFVFINSYTVFLSPSENYIKNFDEYGKAYSILYENGPGSLVRDLDDPGFYRYDSPNFSGAEVLRNSSMIIKVPSTSYYFSTINENVSNFVVDNGLNYPVEATCNNLNSRTILENIATVKYAVVKDGQAWALPYGFDSLVSDNGKYQVYENAHFLPLGFTSATYIPEEEYYELPVEKREEAMAQGIVLEKSNLPETDIKSMAEEVEYELKTSSGLDITEGRIDVTEEQAWIELSFEKPLDGESYLVLQGLEIYPESKPGDEKSRYTLIDVSYGDNMSRLSPRAEHDNYYAERNTFICNLKHEGESIDSVRLAFKDKGFYTFDSIRIVNQPVDEIFGYVDKLREDTLENLEMNVNAIRGEISVAESKALCISIPYSTGWKAKVDGEKVKVSKANGVFLGLEIAAGSHTVELKYSTPYLGLSLIVSLISLVALIVAAKTKRTKNELPQ